MWIVEVQHRSDHDLDGVWYELDRVKTEEAADWLLDYFGTNQNRRYITGSFAGRPLRKRHDS